MDNELMIKNTELVATATSSEISELIKPLIDEIHLFDSYVSGTSRLKDDSVLKEIKTGDKLKLIREESKFDDNAIALLFEDGRKVGYVPERDNVVFARLMDAGKLLSAKVDSISVKGSITQIKIGIYLVDF